MENEGARKKLNNVGMSMVELLCAVAIMALISATIGSIMVVSAKTYQSGTTQTALQQEAQFTANRINGLIHDATDAVNYYYYDDADNLIKAEPVDGPSEQVAQSNGGTGTNRMIEVVNTDKTYQIVYLAGAKQLTYTEVVGGVGGETQLLAENIERFGADVSTFEQSRNITLDIGIEMAGKKYDMEYAVTSRNGETEADVSGVHRSAAIIIDPAEVYLEPCQNYENLKVNVSGTTQGFSQILEGNSDTVNTMVKNHSTLTDILCITMGVNEKGNALGHFYVKIFTNETKDGNPLASRLAQVNVRRVNDMHVTNTLISGAEYSANAVYDIDARVIGTYLEKALGTSYDADYISPYGVEFDCKYQKLDGTELSVDSYFEKVIEKEEKDDAGYPKLQLKLKQDMVSGSRLTITVTAKHPKGKSSEGVAYNKSGLQYDTVQKVIVIEKPAEVPTEPEGGWSDILRAQDYSFKDAEGNGIYATEAYKSIYPQVDNNGVVNADASQNTNPFFNKHSSQQRWFYRMREITGSGYGAWSEYRVCQEQGSAKKLNANETYRMEPDKAYQIEFINVVYDSSSKTLYYPIADELLNCNNGFQDYTAGWTGLGLTATQDYASQYNVGAVELTMDATLTGGSETKTFSDAVNIGTKDDPIVMTSGYELVANLTTTFMHLGNEQAKFTLVAEKWNESTNAWESSSISSQSESTFFKVNNVQNSSTGLYRLKMEIKDWSVRDISTSLLDTNNPVKFTQTYPLYQEATGDVAEKGFVYIKVVAAS